VELRVWGFGLLLGGVTILNGLVFCWKNALEAFPYINIAQCRDDV
jgi:hypothetical protein